MHHPMQNLLLSSAINCLSKQLAKILVQALLRCLLLLRHLRAPREGNFRASFYRTFSDIYMSSFFQHKTILEGSDAELGVRRLLEISCEQRGLQKLVLAIFRNLVAQRNVRRFAGDAQSTSFLLVRRLLPERSKCEISSYFTRLMSEICIDLRAARSLISPLNQSHIAAAKCFQNYVSFKIDVLPMITVFPNILFYKATCNRLDFSNITHLLK